MFIFIHKYWILFSVLCGGSFHVVKCGVWVFKFIFPEVSPFFTGKLPSPLTLSETLQWGKWSLVPVFPESCVEVIPYIVVIYVTVQPQVVQSSLQCSPTFLAPEPVLWMRVFPRTEMMVLGWFECITSKLTSCCGPVPQATGRSK